MAQDQQRNDHTEVKVSIIPNCDMCQQAGVQEAAAYDGKTIMGPWANMCQDHFDQYGIGLGLGRGQRLIKIDTESIKSRSEIAREVREALLAGDWDAAEDAIGDRDIAEFM